jgi:hypothetical protein
MEGSLMKDVFGLAQYITQGVYLYIKLYRSSNPFVLMSGETNPDYKLQILAVALKACKVKVDSGSIVNHIKTIEVTPAKYFFNRTEIKKNTIAKDVSGFLWDNMFSIKPSLLVIGLISQSNGNGMYVGNPLHLKHYSTTEVGLYLNRKSAPCRPLK